MCQGQRAEAVDLRRHADREIVNPQTFRQRELMRKEKKRKENNKSRRVKVLSVLRRAAVAAEKRFIRTRDDVRPRRAFSIRDNGVAGFAIRNAANIVR